VIKEPMGHATIDMTERYAHLSPDTRREAVGVLTGPLRPRATYVQHGGRRLPTTREHGVKKWRRRESNLPPGTPRVGLVDSCESLAAACALARCGWGGTGGGARVRVPAEAAGGDSIVPLWDGSTVRLPYGGWMCCCA
jgi:hypothetical protein